MTSSSFLELVDGPERAWIEQQARRRFMRTGEVLFTEGQRAEALYLIEAGLLRIERVATNGQRQVLTLAGRGDMVGELAVLDRSPRSASAIAMQRTTVLVITADVMHTGFERHPGIALAIARRIADRQRALTDQLLEVAGGTALSRTAARVLQLVDPAVEHGRFEVEVPISQTELAAWAGLSREGTVKALRELRAAGVVETFRRKIVVLDVAALRLASDCR